MRGVFPGAMLSRYLAATFAKWIIGFFLVGTLIIFVADAVELMRRSVGSATFDAGEAVLASLYKTPSLVEEFLPFAVLFGSIAAFIALNRRLELAVLRGAGVSAWQFLVPGLVVAVVIGALATVAFNPLSAAARERSEVLSARVLGNDALFFGERSERVWFRQQGEDGGSIISAAAASPDGATLVEVVAHLYDARDRFAGRIEARVANLEPNAWRLIDVRTYDESGAKSFEVERLLPTALTAREVSETVARADTVSFWNLRAAIATAERAGLPSHRFELQKQVLLARPMLLAAMVLIAASVSLKMVRLGGITRAATGGVVAGFALYIAAAVASDLGEAGVVGPFFAAWFPGLAAALFGVSALLRTEDG